MSKKQPTGKDIIGLSSNQELINEQLYFMKTVPTDDGIGPVLKNVEEHLAYWDEMEEQGVMFAAGPHVPDDPQQPWSGEGIVVFRASSRDEAESIARKDPMHAAGAREYTLQPWLLNHLNTEALSSATTS